MRPKNVTALRRTHAVCIVPVKILAYRVVDGKGAYGKNRTDPRWQGGPDF